MFCAILRGHWWYYCSECGCPNWGKMWWYKG